MKRLVYVVVAALLAVPTTARAEEPAPKPTTVPFELLKTKHMTVEIKVNGKGPYKVIFDTGAPFNLLNNKVAKEAGLIAAKKGFSLFGTQEPVTVKTIEVGDVKADDVPTVIMDHPTVTAISQALGPIEGIVGYTFFARYKMTLDYQAQKMTFVPNGYQPEDAMKEMSATLMKLLQDKKPERRVLAPAAQWGMVVTKAEKDDDAGVEVKEVTEGGAAAKAGLKVGDRLLTLDGRWTDSVADCFTAAGFVKPGKTVKMKVRRDGKEKELTVTPTAGL